MIFTADAPIESRSSVLRALYVSLNSPVVNLEKLPVGPAAAAVALHGPGPGVTLAVRSVRTGHVVFFTSDVRGDERDAPDVVFDAVISFAEGLGFLFDDDEVITRGVEGPRLSAHLWAEFVGDEVGEFDEESFDPETAQSADPEILLDQRADDAPGIADPGAILSKFRRTGEIDASRTIGAMSGRGVGVASGA